MPIKISKVANDLNVGIPTLVEFLQKHNQEVGDPGNLNLRISDEQHEMLVRAFKNDKDLKSKSERYASERQKDKVKNKASQEPKKPEQIKAYGSSPPSYPGCRGTISLLSSPACLVL